MHGQRGGWKRIWEDNLQEKKAEGSENARRGYTKRND